MNYEDFENDLQNVEEKHRDGALTLAERNAAVRDLERLRREAEKADDYWHGAG